MCQDTDKFLELLKPQYSDALKYCKALCSRTSIDDAEDVLQQSLLKGYENFRKLNDVTKFRSWFFKIITREFYDSVRKNFWKKFIPLDNYPGIHQIPEVFDRNETDEDKILLNKALSVLSKKERAAILLFEIGEFSIEEIKDIQNEKSSSAIKSRLSRSRTKMKEFIENYETSNHKQSLKSSVILGDIKNETNRLIAEIERK
ncbi:MAG TPA: RNA polymerase sigma factor [Ignavibacteria bacterium]|nr:RNA polymerase sigma factor [Ignavibacteria bacterium]